VTVSDSDERAIRREFLAKLNVVVELSRLILTGREWTYYDKAWIEEDRDALLAVGPRITSLRQVAKVEKIGWSIGAMGGAMETIGNALVHVAEAYWLRFPILPDDMRRADEDIDELRRLADEYRRLEPQHD
jgi:hypothetical protein